MMRALSEALGKTMVQNRLTLFGIPGHSGVVGNERPIASLRIEVSIGEVRCNIAISVSNTVTSRVGRVCSRPMWPQPTI